MVEMLRMTSYGCSSRNGRRSRHTLSVVNINELSLAEALSDNLGVKQKPVKIQERCD